MTRLGLYFLGFSLIVADFGEIPVFRTAPVGWQTVLVAAGLLSVSLLWDRLEWRFSAAAVKQRVADFYPQNARERWAWILGAIQAGVGEEIAFRGVLFAILAKLTGAAWQAGILAALVFAIVHLPYGTIAAVGIFFYALGFQALVQYSGMLYPAMVVHFLNNVVIGIVFGRFCSHKVAAPLSNQVTTVS